MIITKNLLKEFIDVPENILDITNQKIIEVEEFTSLNESTNLVVGKVLTCEPHPNSDHLNLTTVDLGDRIEKIVCGAPNVAKDQYVIVAQVGSILPGNFEIKKSKIRGEESNGMICSLQELGFDEKIVPEKHKDGIYYFDEEVKIGTPALEAISLEGWKMTLGLTPNRGDLLSIYGFALDLGSVMNLDVKKPLYKFNVSKEKNPFKVDIQTQGCGTYHARYIDQITIKESPWWLKSALISRGMRPINNVVDISNYVLIMLGTPLHMFDANKIKTKNIVVKNATDNQKVISLDGEERILVSSDVVITDGLEPIAIAGVMGLENTMVDDQTTNVLLEAAYFDPKYIQHTSKRLNLRSDASLRFERGVDDHRLKLGLDLATYLLVELADARVYENVVSTVNYALEPAIINIEKSFIKHRLGVELSEKDLLQYFNQYHYQVKTSEKSYEIKVPTYRNDISIDADILEEIARIHGLNSIPMIQEVVPTQGYLTSKQKRLRMIRHHLADLGLNEIISYTLKTEEDAIRYEKIGTPISVLMPLSEDKKVLRQSLINGLLETIKYNKARQVSHMHLFEIGHVFAKDVEKSHLAIALQGIWGQQAWDHKETVADFYLLKGILDETFNRFGIIFDYVLSDDKQYLHPYRQAQLMLDGKSIGVIGEIHPKEMKRLDIDKTIVLEIDLSKIMDVEHQTVFNHISKYPSISRDLAVVVDENLAVKKMLDLIAQTGKKYLVDLKVFDVYQGSHIEKGMKSVAMNLVFNDKNKTLESEDVDKIMRSITIRLDRELKAKVRS